MWAFDGVTRRSPIGVAAVVADLGDQRVEFPQLAGLAAAACGTNLRLDTVEIGQELGITDHGSGAQARVGSASRTPLSLSTTRACCAAPTACR